MCFSYILQWHSLNLGRRFDRQLTSCEVIQVIFEPTLGRSRKSIAVVARRFNVSLALTAVVFAAFTPPEGAKRDLTSKLIKETSWRERTEKRSQGRHAGADDAEGSFYKRPVYGRSDVDFENSSGESLNSLVKGIAYLLIERPYDLYIHVSRIP